jgi:hypothetical protein
LLKIAINKQVKDITPTKQFSIRLVPCRSNKRRKLLVCDRHRIYPESSDPNFTYQPFTIGREPTRV